MRTSPLLLTALVVALAGCKGGNAQEAAATAAPGIAVEVTPAGRADISNEATLSGDLRAARETQVSAKVGGRLDALTVDEGSKVAMGQVIARLDAQDASLQVMQARTSLASAVASRAAAVSRLAASTDRANRLGQLHADGGVSDQEIVATRAEVDANRIAVASADAQIAQAKASIAIAQSAVSNAVVKAPFAGVVTKKSTEVGTMLQPMAPIVTIAATRTLELRVPVGQGQLAGMRPGLEATFSVPTYRDRTFRASVAEVAPTIDARTRTAQVTLRIPNEKGELSPGMFARVKLPTAQAAGALVLPADAIVTDGEAQYVFVVTGEKATRKPVRLGLRTADRVEVVSGVAPGDQVVTLGQGQLKSGDTVRIVKGE